ncbi:hypothetical protein BBK82_29790 [Lentzea guizhouensis]|uniref:Anti-sigma factor antagonist n=1 Tax=Lentzea guizhouensis TaxID=1586287 RepID=A0A1B2HPK1_9PSEU|nr:STAS domain-containing protein [Lentzea guizhouensis]ANZ39615.1 hypothetical protein BBK82_29790 [Lentzea guizhouensis]
MSTDPSGGGPAMQMAHSTHRGVVVLRVTGEVDMTNAGQVQVALTKALAAAQRGVVVELAVEFFDSAGLVMLVEANRQAAEAGAPFGIVATARAAKQPVMMTGLHELLTMFDDVEAAVGAFAPAAHTD